VQVVTQPTASDFHGGIIGVILRPVSGADFVSPITDEHLLHGVNWWFNFRLRSLLHSPDTWSFPAQNGECFENVRDKSHSLDDREHGCPILPQPEGTECASQRRAIYRCDFPRIAAGKTIFLHLGPPQRSPHRRYDR